MKILSAAQGLPEAGQILESRHDNFVVYQVSPSVDDVGLKE